MRTSTPLVVVTAGGVAEAELVADTAWRHGATGIWETEVRDGVELRIGVAEGDVTRLVAALGPRRVRVIEAGPGPRIEDSSVSAGGDRFTLGVPGNVFGDGRHPTTRGCLAALGALVRPGTTVLDVGTGSGVLAVAAARLGAEVRAVDLDRDAVRATEANAVANAVVIEVDSTPLAEIATTFDVVVANLSAATLVGESGGLGDTVRPGGTLVVSGILVDQWPAVRAAFVELGLAELGAETDEGWVTARLVRPAGS